MSHNNNRPQSYDILNERGNVLARNRRHVIPTTERFNIKHDYDNTIQISNTSTHLNLKNNDQHGDPALENVYRTKSGRILKS